MWPHMTRLVFLGSAPPRGRVAHPEGQNEDKNEESLRKNKKKKMIEVELLPTRDCEAGYAPLEAAVCKLL